MDIVIGIFARSLLFLFLSPFEPLSADNRLFTQNKTMKTHLSRVCVCVLLSFCMGVSIIYVSAPLIIILLMR